MSAVHPVYPKQQTFSGPGRHFAFVPKAHPVVGTDIRDSLDPIDSLRSRLPEIGGAQGVGGADTDALNKRHRFNHGHVKGADALGGKVLEQLCQANREHRRTVTAS
jgi:hypothetical protein